MKHLKYLVVNINIIIRFYLESKYSAFCGILVMSCSYDRTFSKLNLVKHNNKIKIKTEITKKVGALFKKKISNLKIGV